MHDTIESLPKAVNNYCTTQIKHAVTSMHIKSVLIITKLHVLDEQSNQCWRGKLNLLMIYIRMLHLFPVQIDLQCLVDGDNRCIMHNKIVALSWC